MEKSENFVEIALSNIISVGFDFDLVLVEQIFKASIPLCPGKLIRGSGCGERLPPPLVSNETLANNDHLLILESCCQRHSEGRYAKQ